MHFFHFFYTLRGIKQLFLLTTNNNKKMKDLVKKIEENIELFKVNAEAQVVKGNKAAGARARKAALDLMKDLKEFRKISVAEAKN